MVGILYSSAAGFARKLSFLPLLVLAGRLAAQSSAINTPVAIVVDAQRNRHAISPLIYGTAFAPSAAQLTDLNSPLHRSGGNSETRYNWQLNAHNHAADWYFESLDDGSPTPAASADKFVTTSRSGGAEPILTVPMIGWAPKLGPNRGKLASYSIAKYGPQTGNDGQWMPDAGNGISATNGHPPITWNDPTDANFATNSSFQQAFVRHLTNRFGLSINGATAQADLLGIFGREGLDLATRWTTPDPATPTYKAMKMFRNYDGNHSTFGDTSVYAAGPNPDNVSAFAALRTADGALTLIVINKQITAGATATVTVTNRLLAGTAQVWQLTSANAISRFSDFTFSGATFTSTVPAQSITLFVLPAAAPPPSPQLRAGTMSRTNTFDLWLDGAAGQRYALLSSTDLKTWQPVQTNTLTGTSWHIVLPAASGHCSFYRGQHAP